MNKILNYISDQFVFRNLNKISYGYLSLVDARGKEYFFGNSKSKLITKIVKAKSLFFKKIVCIIY